MKFPISLDTALTAVGNLRCIKINTLDSINEPDVKEKIQEEIKMLKQEESLLYGKDQYSKLSVMDKVVRLYAPILREYYGN